MVTCNTATVVRVSVVALLIVPALTFWIWLMKEAIITSSRCPHKCWCGADDSTVDCTGASLQDIPPNLSRRIRNLVFSYNHITVLRTNHFVSAGLTELDMLTLASNGIHTVEVGAFHGLPKLENLHLKDNYISTFTMGAFSDLTKLTGLHLANNTIKKLPHGIFQELINLRYISLEENEIEEVEADVFIGLTSLKNLWLTDNKITYLEPNVFKHMPNLSSISLSNNKGLIIPTDRPFLNVPTLQTYLLAGCNIRKLTEKSFEMSPNLTTIRLDNNSLSTFNMNILKRFTKLKTISLPGNPLNCDCHLLEVWKWCKKYDITVGVADNVPRCTYPNEVADLWWGVLSKAECSNGIIQFKGDFKSIVHEYIPYMPEYESHLKFMTYAESSVYGILFLIGATGNITLLIIIGFNKRMRTIPNAYIFNLAVADLLSLTMNLPLSQAMKLTPHWVLGEFMCKLAMFCRQLSIGVAGFSVAVLSTQRYFSTSGSVNLSTKRSTVIAIASVWLAAFCFSLPSAFSVHVEFEVYCSPFHSLKYYSLATTFHLLIFCIVPLCIIVSMYVMTARTLVRRVQTSEEESRTYTTLAKIVIGLSVVFFISFVPYHVLWTVLVWYSGYFQPVIGYLIFFCLCLLVLNSCLNPIALCYTSVTFRKLFKYYLFCCRRPLAQNDDDSDLPEGKEGAVKYKRDVLTEAVVL